MTYPSFPVAGHVPVFLDAFDPSFMGGQFPVAATDPPAFGVIVGGLGALPGPSSGGSIITTNQWNALQSGWAALRNEPTYVPQRIGLKYAFVNLLGASDGGAIG